LKALRDLLGPDHATERFFNFNLAIQASLLLFCVLVSNKDHRLQLLHQCATFGTACALYAVAGLGGSQNLLFVARATIPEEACVAYRTHISSIWKYCGPFKQFEVPGWLSNKLGEESTAELRRALRLVDLTKGFEDYGYGVDPLTMMTHMVLAVKLLILVYSKDELFILTTLLPLVNAWYNFLKSGVDNKQSQVAIPTDRVFRRNTPGFAIVLFFVKHLLQNAKAMTQVVLWCKSKGCVNATSIERAISALGGYTQFWNEAKRGFSMQDFYRDLAFQGLITSMVGSISATRRYSQQQMEQPADASSKSLTCYVCVRTTVSE
jgi:hypothetical protein